MLHTEWIVEGIFPDQTNKFRMDFEGGDAETSVLFMPGMTREIKISFKIRSEGNYRHFLEIINVK